MAVENFLSQMPKKLYLCDYLVCEWLYAPLYEYAWYQHRSLTHLLSTLPSEIGLEFTEWLDRLGSKAPTPLGSASPALESRPDSVCLYFYMSNRDPYWGLCIWAVSTLSTELNLAPSFCDFNVSSTDFYNLCQRKHIWLWCMFKILNSPPSTISEFYPMWKNQTLNMWASLISWCKAIILKF